MWQRYWHLTSDPFLGAQSPFVHTKTHAEAFARLAAAVEGGQGLAVLRGAEGLGKSTLVAALNAGMKGPFRRFSRVVSPSDGTGLFAGLAAGLGVKAGPPLSRASAWKAIGDAARLCRFQRQQVVLIVDDAQSLESPADFRDLERLRHADPHPDGRLTLVVCLREPDTVDGEPAAFLTADWLPAVRLVPLARSETIDYVTAKLAAAGRGEPAFTPKALARLHDLSGGVPRGIDHLATLALMAGAVRGLEIIPPDVIDGVARECDRPDRRPGAAA